MSDLAEKPDLDDEVSLVDLAATLWRRKMLIVAFTAAAAVLSVVYALMQPNMFTASATMLPISGSSSSMLSQYAGLAAMAGVSLPSGSSANSVVKIEAILKSRSFAENLVAEMNLVPLLIEHPEKIKMGTPLGIAVRALQGMLTVSTDTKTSVMKIVVKTKSATLSSAIANGALDMIQKDLAARVLSSSGKNIILLEQQSAEQEQKVRAAQNKLTAYQKKNKFVQPQAQSTRSLQLYQALIQQKMTLEVEISRLESALSSDNPKIVSAQTQLDAIKKQMADFEKTGGGVGPSMSETPAALMEYANLTAELELATKVYDSLITSLESVKLQDATEKVFVEVIDRAIPPERKSEPSRSKICVIGTMAGGFFSVLLAFVLDAMGKLISDPEVRAKFSAVAKRKQRKS
ncbi:MAG TPA: Wzz/FepE/Etk N-terminal domain-containing protein [Rectinemataceae bacterium]|nr:Wzz/FepE/Etk N-terminal domain-containing protein [Rectinemataceae bacterium]